MENSNSRVREHVCLGEDMGCETEPSEAPCQEQEWRKIQHNTARPMSWAYEQEEQASKEASKTI